MDYVNIDTFHNLVFKGCYVEELVVTGQIYCQTSKDEVEDGKTHQEDSDTVLVGFVKGSLSFHHAS